MAQKVCKFLPLIWPNSICKAKRDLTGCCKEGLKQPISWFAVFFKSARKAANLPVRSHLSLQCQQKFDWSILKTIKTCRRPTTALVVLAARRRNTASDIAKFIERSDFKPYQLQEKMWASGASPRNWDCICIGLDFTLRVWMTIWCSEKLRLYMYQDRHHSQDWNNELMHGEIEVDFILRIGMTIWANGLGTNKKKKKKKKKEEEKKKLTDVQLVSYLVT